MHAPLAHGQRKTVVTLNGHRRGEAILPTSEDVRMAEMNHNSVQYTQAAQHKAYLREALKNFKQAKEKESEVSPHPPPGERGEQVVHGGLRPGPIRVTSLQEGKEKAMSAFKALNNTYPGANAHFKKEDMIPVQDMEAIVENHTHDVQVDGIPEPASQRDVIARIDTECTCTYAVQRLWYRKWEEYVGAQKPSAGVVAEAPGPVDMDAHNDANNEYINEDAWKCLVSWYGIAPNHQLDRKHLYFKDEKMFDVCMLSPFSGIVEHTVKKFNRFEEVGYIECQLRKIFHIADHKKTRLWISEKAQVPRFRQLLLRFRMLNDCIHRDKVYILALEEGLTNDSWPTGEPGEAKGELTKYSEIVIGLKADDHWSQEIENSLDSLSTSVSESIGQMAEAFLQNGRHLIEERESTLERARKLLETKHEEIKAKEQFLNDKTRELAKEEEQIKTTKEDLGQERQEFEEARDRFRQEIETLEKVHRIQETKIKLDIGGQIHTTSIQTLRRDPDSMLAAMFSGRHELSKEQDGSYFIDRDGTFFRYILNFLRDGTLDSGTLPNNVPALREILREARYYQLNGMVQYLEEMIERGSTTTP